MSDLYLGLGLRWTSPLRDIKILYIYVAIHKLTAKVRNDDTHKYLVILHALRFNVSNINRSSRGGKEVYFDSLRGNSDV